MHHGVAKFYTIDSLPSENVRNVWLILKARAQVHTHTQKEREMARLVWSSLWRSLI